MIAPESDVYFSIKTTSQGEFKDRGSKFKSEIHVVNNEMDIHQILQSLKKTHPKANHVCYAYRLGSSEISYRSNDDGEPAGSAGKPILNTLISKNLTNVLATVVRYFGGTELGIPGLINAYKTACQLSIDNSEIITNYLYQNIVIQHSFENTNAVMKIVKNYQSVAKGILITDTTYHENSVKTILKVRQSIANQVIEAIQNNYLLQLNPEYTEKIP